MTLIRHKPIIAQLKRENETFKLEYEITILKDIWMVNYKKTECIKPVWSIRRKTCNKMIGDDCRDQERIDEEFYKNEMGMAVWFDLHPPLGGYLEMALLCIRFVNRALCSL